MCGGREGDVFLFFRSYIALLFLFSASLSELYASVPVGLRTSLDVFITSFFVFFFRIDCRVFASPVVLLLSPRVGALTTLVLNAHVGLSLSLLLICYALLVSPLSLYLLCKGMCVRVVRSSGCLHMLPTPIFSLLILQEVYVLYSHGSNAFSSLSALPRSLPTPPTPLFLARALLPLC